MDTKEYEAACSKLIAQFKTVRSALGKSHADVESFMAAYGMHCPYARQRLLVSGMPATIEHSAPKDDSQVAKAAAECTQFFITAMDSLKVRRPVGTKVKVVCKDWSAVAPVRL